MYKRQVYENIKNKDIYVPTTANELRESLMFDYCIGTFYKGKLNAVTIMVSNRHNSRNLGYSLYTNHEKCKKIVTYDSSFVHPDFCGYSIQQFFIIMRDTLARKLGAEEALATVSPNNPYSLNNVLNSGFDIVAEKKLYGGHNRYILRKSFEKNIVS